MLCGALALIASSCGIRLKEELPPSEPMRLGDTGTGCLSGSSGVFTRYLDGEASDAEISRVWDCASTSLSRFTEETRGSSVGQYRPVELKRFLEKYFLNEPISDGLMRQSMILKRALLGGSADVLTVREIERLQRLLGVLRAQTLRMRRWMPLSLSRAAAMERQPLCELISDLQVAAAELGGAIEETGNAYELSDLEAFHEEAYRFIKGSKVPESSFLRRYRELIRRAKALLIGPEADRIGGKQWARLLTSVAGWTGVTLRAMHLREHRGSLFRGEDREVFSGLGSETLRLIEEGVAGHRDQVIPFESLDSFIDASVGAGLFETLPVSPENLKALLKDVIRRGLGGTDLGPMGRQAAGLTRSGVIRLRREFESWSLAQKYLEQLFDRVEEVKPGAGDEFGFRVADLQDLSIEKVTGRRLRDHSALEQDAIRSVYRLIRVHPPLFARDDFEITFPRRKGAEPRLSLHHLSMLNWLNAITRLLFEGYSNSPDIISGQYRRDISPLRVTVDEFNELYLAFRPVGVEVKFFDPDKWDVPFKRFREGNLFTFAADGDGYLNLEEGVQLFAIMFSGKLLANRTHAEIADKSEVGFEHDKFGARQIVARDYRAVLYGQLRHFWRRMPELVDYHEKLAPAEKERFGIELEKTARAGGYTERLFDSPDSETIAMLAQYLEVLFSRFDANQSGTIDREESRAVFAVVRQELAKVVPGQDEGMLEAILTYCLAYGKPPEETTNSGKAHFVQWLARKRFWSFEADRSRVLRILMTFSAPPSAAMPASKP